MEEILDICMSEATLFATRECLILLQTKLK